MEGGHCNSEAQERGTHQVSERRTQLARDTTAPEATALSQRIAQARQRLRTAQVSLLESLEQVSPSSSPAGFIRPTRNGASSSALSSGPGSPARGADPTVLAAAEAAAGAVAAAMAGAAGSSCAAAGSGCAAAVAANGGGPDSPGRPQRAVDVASVRAALLQEVDEMEAGDEGWSDEDGSSGSDSDDEREEGDSGRGRAASGEGDDPADGASAAVRDAENGAPRSEDGTPSGGKRRDPDLDAGKEVASGPGRAMGLPPPRELFNFDALYGGGGGKGDESNALPPPPRMRTGYPMLHPPPVHLQDEPALPEPLRPNPRLEELVASLMAADAERIQNPSLSLSRVSYDAFDPLELSSNFFVRDDCLHSILPAIDAPLGEVAPLIGAPAVALASSSAPDADDAPPKPMPSTGLPAAAAAAAAAANSPRRRVAAPQNRDMLVFESRFESGTRI
jgi:hypothetical protein